jgi:hypothetical protein
VLHLAGHDLPALAVIPVGVPTVRTGPVAVPDVAFLRVRAVEGGKALLGDA